MRLTERNASNEPRARRKLAMVRCERPRCPNCKRTQLRKYRSIADQGDGTALAWVRCTDCGEKFRVVYE